MAGVRASPETALPPGEAVLALVRGEGPDLCRENADEQGMLRNEAGNGPGIRARHVARHFMHHLIHEPDGKAWGEEEVKEIGLAEGDERSGVRDDERTTMPSRDDLRMGSRARAGRLRHRFAAFTMAMNSSAIACAMGSGTRKRGSPSSRRRSSTAP